MQRKPCSIKSQQESNAINQHLTKTSKHVQPEIGAYSRKIVDFTMRIHILSMCLYYKAFIYSYRYGIGTNRYIKNLCAKPEEIYEVRACRV